MALANYTDLQGAILDWSERADLAGQAATFIRLAEIRINERLRTAWQETKDTLTPDANGVCALPSDYLEWRSVTALSSPRRRLEYVTLDYADFQFADREAAPSRCFTVQGSSLLLFPVSETDVELVYYAKVPELSDASPTNWLLTRNPNVYLWASLIELATYIEDETKLARYGQFYDRAMADIMQADKSGRWARGAARISGPTP